MKFLIIKFIHRLIRKISLSKILVLSYPIGFIYYFWSARPVNGKLTTMAKPDQTNILIRLEPQDYSNQAGLSRWINRD